MYGTWQLVQTLERHYVLCLENGFIVLDNDMHKQLLDTHTHTDSLPEPHVKASLPVQQYVYVRGH